MERAIGHLERRIVFIHAAGAVIRHRRFENYADMFIIC